VACCGKKNKEAAINIPLEPTPTIAKLSTENPIDSRSKKHIIYIKDSDKINESVRARSALCSMCVENLNGVCIESREETTGGHATVESLINNQSTECPKHVWKSNKNQTNEKKSCTQCGRIHTYGADICKVCVQTLERKRRNLERGIGSKPNLLAHTRARKEIPENIDYTIRQDPFVNPVVKNLHFFIYPKYEISTVFHLEKLKESIDTFNGKRICCIAIDEDTVQDKFLNEFNALFTDIYMVSNNPKKRERAGFIPSLEKLQTFNKDEAICFAHGKGQQYHTKSSPVIIDWTSSMYETCVNNWDNVKYFMEKGYPAVGSFKNNSAFRNTPFAWHYSGSFWWCRSYKLFQRNWRNICNRWWGSESYVGRQFTREEGACLFGEMLPGESLYEHHTWNRINSELENWRKNNVLS